MQKATSSTTSLTLKSIACALSALGVTFASSESDVEPLADLVGQRRRAQGVAHRFGGLVEPDGALVALRAVVVEPDGPLADLLDEGLVGLAGDDLDRILEADDVAPLARRDEVEGVEHLGRQVVLGQLVDQLDDGGCAHGRGDPSGPIRGLVFVNSCVGASVRLIAAWRGWPGRTS